jgi:hypothetical protein
MSKSLRKRTHSLLTQQFILFETLSTREAEKESTVVSRVAIRPRLVSIQSSSDSHNLTAPDFQWPI